MASAPCLEARPAARRASGFLTDTLTLSVIAGVAKAAGAAKSIAIAHVFGSGPELDSYLLAFLIPSVLADTFCGALVPVTVPRLIELEHRSGRGAAQALYGRLLAQSVRFSMLGAAAVAMAIAGYLLLGAAAAPAKWRMVGLLALLMLPVIPFNAVANVWRAVLNSRSSFAAPAATVLFTPAAITLAVVLAGSGSPAWLLAAATTTGAAGELILLGLAMRGSGYPILPLRWTPRRSSELPWRGLRMDAFRKEYGYLAASGAVSGGIVAIGQVMAAWLGPGSVSVLNYGTRLSTVLMSIGPAALGVAVLPHLSRVAAQQDWSSVRQSLRPLLYGSSLASVAAAGVFILFSAPIVRLTLQHGAFTSADTGAVAAVQIWSLLQMPFVVGISILMRVFSVMKANRVLLPLSVGSLIVSVALNYALMGRYGVAGISMAASIAQALLFGAMTWLVFGSREKLILQGSV